MRQRIGAVMKWAIANNYRLDNPAGDAIEAVLPKTSRTQAHHKALHYTAVPAALRAVRVSKSTESSKLSLESQVLTASRPGEARNARWSEVGVGDASPPHAARTSNDTRARVIKARIFGFNVRPSLLFNFVLREDKVDSTGIS